MILNKFSIDAISLFGPKLTLLGLHLINAPCSPKHWKFNTMNDTEAFGKVILKHSVSKTMN